MQLYGLLVWEVNCTDPSIHGMSVSLCLCPLFRQPVAFKDMAQTYNICVLQVLVAIATEQQHHDQQQYYKQQQQHPNKQDQQQQQKTQKVLPINIKDLLFCRCAVVAGAVAVAAAADGAIRSLAPCDVTGSMANCDPDCLSCTTQ